MKTFRNVASAWAFCLLFLASPASWATGTATGEIRGGVRDGRTGLPLAGVTVVLLGTSLTGASGPDGSFRLAGIPPGDYSLSLSRIGYRPAFLRDVAISPGRPVLLEVPLEPSALEMPGIVVSAAKRPQSFEAAPVSLSVMGANELAPRNLTTLDEALDVLPGVHRVGGDLSIRGSSGYSRGTGSRVLILLDGFPSLSADMADVKWDAIPAELVERVEVVKSAGSALYGTGALGGVVNVLTRAPSDTPETRLNLLGGYYTAPHYPSWKWTRRLLGYHTLQASHSRKVEGLRFLVSASRKYSTGYHENGRHDRIGGFGRLQYLFSARTSATLLVNAASDDHDVTLQWKDRNQPLEVPDAAVGDRTVSRKLSVNAQLDRLVSRRVTSRARASFYRTWFENDVEGRKEGSRAVRWWGEAQHEYRPARRLTLTQGTEVAADRVASAPALFGNRSAASVGIYLQGDLEPVPSLALSAGLRYDRYWRKYLRGEARVSPKLGLAWRMGSRATMRASLGRGFRAPSISEIYTNSTFAGVPIRPNPDLRAESSLMGEWGAGCRLGGWGLLDGAIFVSRFRGLIEARPDETQTVRFQNVSRGRVSGFEASLQADWGGAFHLSANGTRVAATEHMEDGRDLPLPYRPAWIANAAVTCRRGPARAGVEYRYASRIRRGSSLFAEGNRDLIPIHLADLFAGLETRRYRLTLRIQNLLQYHYAQVERSLGEIRNASLGLGVVW